MLAAMEERLPTEIWVKAHLRRCFAEAIHVAVLRKGDANGGTVLLKVLQRDSGCRVLSQMRDMDIGDSKDLEQFIHMFWTIVDSWYLGGVEESPHDR